MLCLILVMLKGKKRKQRKGLRNGEGAALEKAVRDCLTEKVAFG